MNEAERAKLVADYAAVRGEIGIGFPRFSGEPVSKDSEAAEALCDRLRDEHLAFREALELISGCCARYRKGSGYAPNTFIGCREDGTPRPMMCEPCKAANALKLPVGE